MHFTKNTLGKHERLKSRKLINELFENGNSFHHFPFKIVYKSITNDKESFPVKFAVSVSKRNFKLAVDRNRIKRKIREAYRLNKLSLYNTLHKSDQNIALFVIYTANEELDYNRLNKEIDLILQKLIKRLNVISKQ